MIDSLVINIFLEDETVIQLQSFNLIKKPQSWTRPYRGIWVGRGNTNNFSEAGRSNSGKLRETRA